MEDVLELVEPGDPYAAPFLEMAEAFQAAGEDRFERDLPLLRADFAAYVDRLRKSARGENLPPGYVPGDEFWLVERASGKIIGIIRLRRWLTPILKERGGHIGYAVRPGERRKGYGTQMLAMLLDKLRDPAWQAARGLRLERVLVTCNSSNTPSARIIESNGGVMENQVLVDGELVSRYWIDLFPGRDQGADGESA